MLTELAKFAKVPNLLAYVWIDTAGQHACIEFNQEGKNDGKPKNRIAFAPEVVDYLTNWLKGTNTALGVARFTEQLELHSFNEDDHEIEDEGESHYVKVFIMCQESVLPQLILKGLTISETTRY